MATCLIGATWLVWTEQFLKKRDILKERTNSGINGISRTSKTRNRRKGFIFSFTICSKKTPTKRAAWCFIKANYPLKLDVCIYLNRFKRISRLFHGKMPSYVLVPFALFLFRDLFHLVKEVQSCYFQSYRFVLTSAADHFQYPKIKIGCHRPSSPTFDPLFCTFHMAFHMAINAKIIDMRSK